MKTSVQILSLSLCLMLSACSTEDDSNGTNPSNNTIEASIDEKPSSGDLITTVTSNLPGALSFTLSSTSVSNAFTLDGSSGELKVAAWQVFDFETNPVITATVNVNNGTDTENKVIIVNLNDKDDIWLFLNASRSAYENANIGQWIAITQSEYNDLANYLYNVSKCGATDSQYNYNSTIYYDDSYYTYANDNGATIAAEHYLFAFKYKCNADNLSNTKVKISNNVETGYQNLGNSVPMHDSGENYFVIKGNSMTNSDPTYMAVGAESFGYLSGISGNSFKYDAFDVNTLPFNWTGIALYQGLTTSLKQWD